jgi:hypothetical protein
MEAVKKAPSWVGRVLMPEIGEMKGDIKSLDTKVTEMDKRMNIRFDSITRDQANQFDSLKAMIRNQNEKFEFQRELAVLKAKVAELEKRK